MSDYLWWLLCLVIAFGTIGYLAGSYQRHKELDRKEKEGR